MRTFTSLLLFALIVQSASAQSQSERPTLRELGFELGVLPPGPLNAITDVAGVRVGHATLIRGENIRTGVTAVLPHGGNLFTQKVPGAIFTGNGFGKLAGSTQVEELGEIESPILLTSTLNVPKVADAVLDSMLALEGNEDVRSINVIVAETNDGQLNAIRARPVGRDEVLASIRGADTGRVEEGSVGAGTGTIAFGFKGGIGTSSRRLPPNLGGYTIGVLVQSNFGGVLSIAGVPVGRELGRHYLREELGRETDRSDGSIIIVIATDAPVDARNLRRMGARAMMGLARTGAAGTNGSGDYAIAFSTAPSLRIEHGRTGAHEVSLLANDSMSPIFFAVIEATEEAIYNSLFRARTIEGNGRTVEALPIEKVLAIMERHGARGHANR